MKCYVLNFSSAVGLFIISAYYSVVYIYVWSTTGDSNGQ